MQTVSGQDINTRGMDSLLPNSPGLSAVLQELAGFKGSGLANMPVVPNRKWVAPRPPCCAPPALPCPAVP